MKWKMEVRWRHIQGEALVYRYATLAEAWFNIDYLFEISKHPRDSWYFVISQAKEI